MKRDGLDLEDGPLPQDASILPEDGQNDSANKCHDFEDGSVDLETPKVEKWPVLIGL
jgi:hypothetical protein